MMGRRQFFSMLTFAAAGAALSGCQWCEDIARLCPRGRLVLIPEVAHTLCYTAPVELADVTRSFVNEAKDLML